MTAQDLSALFPQVPQHRLANRTCLITGASSGLGRSIALAYAAHGADLIVCADLQPEVKLGPDGDKTPTHELIEKVYGAGKAVYVKVDVSVGADIKRAVDKAVEMTGRLDVIVNNAGLGTANRWIRLHELEDEEWEKVMRVNSTGVFFGCKYALAQFMKQGPGIHGRRGWIVNVSSILGIVGITGGGGAYCASKGAVMLLTKQIALDYAKDKINCNALCPGFMKTHMTIQNFEDAEANAEMINTTPMGDWGHPDDIAKGAVFLASDDASWVTGIPLPVDGGFLAK